MSKNECGRVFSCLVCLSRVFYWFKLEYLGKWEYGTVKWFGKSDGTTKNLVFQ